MNKPSDNNSAPTVVRSVSIPTKIAYGMGQGISSVKDMLFHFFFLFYFTNLLGVSELLVVVASSIALIVDAVSDPLMGQISDNYRSKKWGRRHVFMAYSIVPTGLFLALLFSPPAHLGEWALFLWMTGFSILVRLALTVFRVPYYSLGAELSSDYNERTNIVSVREIFNGLFNISVFVIGFTVFLPDSEQFEDGMMNIEGYAPLALTMALIGCIGALVATFGTRHMIPRLSKHEGQPTSPIWQMFGEIRRALALKSFRIVTLGYSAMAVLYGISSALSLYYGVYLWQLSQDAKALFAAIPVLILLPATVLASWLAKRWDKREAGLVFAAAFLAGSVIPFAGYLLEMLPPLGGSELFLVIALSHALASLGIIGIIILSFSMLADVVDELAVVTHKRQEGILYSAFSFVQKLTFTLGTAFASASLFVIHFPKQAEPSEVATSTLNNLAVVGFSAALVFGVLTIVCFLAYPLSRTKLYEIQAALNTPR